MDPRVSLALWLRAGRAQRKLTLDDVARVTKIQSKILEKIEAGYFDGLPAEVFVKGFVRSFARCVGLDEREALERYGACVGIAPVARALVETMSDLAPVTARKIEQHAAQPMVLTVEPAASAEIEIVVIEAAAEPVIEVVDVVVEAAPVADPVALIAIEAPVAPAKKKRAPRKKAVAADGTAPAPRTRKKKATPAPSASMPIEVAAVVVAANEIADASIETKIEAKIEELAPVEAAPAIEIETAPIEIDAVLIEVDVAPVSTAIEVIDATADEPAVADAPWLPTMPPMPSAPSAPWRRPAFAASTYVAPSLVIDDADPDSAEQEREDRETASRATHRVSFLPQILLDREDKAGRQGGLTLAVIILLIAATLTLSYLMRRPSVSGDGVTLNAAAPATLVS